MKNITNSIFSSFKKNPFINSMEAVIVGDVATVHVDAIFLVTSKECSEFLLEQLTDLSNDECLLPDQGRFYFDLIEGDVTGREFDILTEEVSARTFAKVQDFAEQIKMKVVKIDPNLSGILVSINYIIQLMDNK